MPRWRQTNTEFHRDWTAEQNQGDHLGWKPGLSVDAPPAQRYAAKVVFRRRIRWRLWLGILAFGIALVVADQIVSSW